MDDDADAVREYERLRAELAEFVMGVLAERLAAGEEPKLSQALIDAIDRRVEDAVAARLGSGAIAESEQPSRPTRRRQPAEAPWFMRWRVAIVSAVVLAVLATAAFFYLNRTTAPTRTQTYNGIEVITVEPTPDGLNAQQPPANGAVPANAAAPADASPQP